MAYIDLNPLRAGLVERPEEYLNLSVYNDSDIVPATSRIQVLLVPKNLFPEIIVDSKIILCLKGITQAGGGFGRDLFVKKAGGELNLLNADSSDSHRFVKK